MTTEPEMPKEPIPERRQLFNELVLAHYDKIRNYLRSIGLYSSAVDDAAQEAFLVAYKRFDSYKQGTSFPSWVCTIARNLVWNDRRKHSRRQRILNDVVTEVLISTDPSEELCAREDLTWQRTALRACMEQLPEKNRALVEKRYKQDLEPTQIARNEGSKPATVRLRLMRIRRALHDCITKYLDQRPNPE